MWDKGGLTGNAGKIGALPDQAVFGCGMTEIAMIVQMNGSVLLVVVGHIIQVQISPIHQMYRKITLK